MTIARQSIHVDTNQLSDELFLMQFENQTLSPVHFSHIGHLRLAWLYLNHYDVETAAQRTCTGIKRYAESLGAHTKFHLTITDSLVRIMAGRVNQSQATSWLAFLADNQDLVDDAIAVLLLYFSRDVLFSESARTTLAAPDIQPI